MTQKAAVAMPFLKDPSLIVAAEPLRIARASAEPLSDVLTLRVAQVRPGGPSRSLALSPLGTYSFRGNILSVPVWWKCRPPCLR